MDKISFNQFQQLDIRIGTVVSAEVPGWSHWVLKMKVDFASEAKSSKDRSPRRVRTEPKILEGRSGGEEEIGTKICFAGIMKFFKPEELVGRQFPFVLNIKPKKIGPNKEKSEAMMIMAVPKDDEETPPVLFKLEKKVENGTRVF